MKTRSDEWTKVDVRPASSEMRENGGVAEDRECEELVLRVVRDVGVGLGMSITGGVGTTAFRDGDEVDRFVKRWSTLNVRPTVTQQGCVVNE